MDIYQMWRSVIGTIGEVTNRIFSKAISCRTLKDHGGEGVGWYDFHSSIMQL